MDSDDKKLLALSAIGSISFVAILLVVFASLSGADQIGLIYILSVFL